MDGRAVGETLEGIGASVAALAVVLRRAGFVVSADGNATAAGAVPLTSADSPSHQDPLRDQADAYLDGLAGVAGLEARLAALKVSSPPGTRPLPRPWRRGLVLRRSALPGGWR